MIQLHATFKDDKALSAKLEGADEAALRAYFESTVNVNPITDYTKLTNLPSIEDVKLLGNKTFSDLGITQITNLDINNIITGR